MDSIISVIEAFGDGAIVYFWFPLLVWTVIAVPLLFVLQKSEKLPPLYQHHSRVALIFTLPLAILGSYLNEFIGQALSSGEPAITKFIIVQNPISVAVAPAQVSSWHFISNPAFWIGLLSFATAAVILWQIISLLINWLKLRSMITNLKFNPLHETQWAAFNEKEIRKVPLVAFSDETDIPFTCGWRNTKLVIPVDLKNQHQKTAMAIRHELVHIKNNDYLLNALLMIVKALFCFHPLVNMLYHSSREFREITCDGEVLKCPDFSKKQYASLLYELAERARHTNGLAMSMAVEPSTLKKRIQIMADQNLSIQRIRTSYLITLFVTGLMVLVISCSTTKKSSNDKNSSEEVTAAKSNKKSNNAPLVMINGEKSTFDKYKHIKSKYITSRNILRGQEAIDKYGDAGKNGVLEVTLDDKEKAFSDLKTDQELKKNAGNVQKTKNVPGREIWFFKPLKNLHN